MIRILVDDHGTRSDLFVRIDGSPEHVFVADTGWLCSFFSTDTEDALLWDDEKLIYSKRNDVALLVNFWLETLAGAEQTMYLPFDLSDQCGNALQITRGRRVMRISEVWTTDVIDGTSQAYFLRSQASINWQVDPEYTWDLALKSIMTGLDWSLAQLQLPIVPLRYE